MGLTKSRYHCGQFTELPITSLTINDGLFIIYTADNKYIRPAEIVLTVKENKESSSSKDGCIYESNGMKSLHITECGRDLVTYVLMNKEILIFT